MPREPCCQGRWQIVLQFAPTSARTKASIPRPAPNLRVERVSYTPLRDECALKLPGACVRPLSQELLRRMSDSIELLPRRYNQLFQHVPAYCPPLCPMNILACSHGFQ